MTRVVLFFIGLFCISPWVVSNNLKGSIPNNVSNYADSIQEKLSIKYGTILSIKNISVDSKDKLLPDVYLANLMYEFGGIQQFVHVHMRVLSDEKIEGYISKGELLILSLLANSKTTVKIDHYFIKNNVIKIIKRIRKVEVSSNEFNPSSFQVYYFDRIIKRFFYNDFFVGLINTQNYYGAYVVNINIGEYNDFVHWNYDVPFDFRRSHKLRFVLRTREQAPNETNYDLIYFFDIGTLELLSFHCRQIYTQRR
jgi:hypothetical protein